MEQHRTRLKESLSKLSSGLRINNASDDAAGLAVSESMRSQIRSFSVAERNAFDGMSMAQTADGALGEAGDVLGRMRELAMQSSNGALNDNQRAMIDTEFGELQSQLGQLQEGTEFNGQQLLGQTAETVEIQAGLDDAPADQIALNFGGLDLSEVQAGSTGVGSAGGALQALGRIDQALETVSTSRAGFGAGINRLSSAANGISEQRLNLVEAESRIRDADMAQESSNVAREGVMADMGLAVQAQANMLPQNAFQLLA